MTDAHHTMSYIKSIDWTARREAALDKACVDLQRFMAEHPHEDVDVAVDVFHAVVGQIFAAPLATLNDIRVYAKALLEQYEDSEQDYDRTRRLLTALATLPERLWNEPIGAEESPQ